MHEMSYAVRIADIALRAANANPPGSASADNRPAGGLNPKDGSSENRILAVHVSCGEMLAIVPSLLETAFRECVKGTIAENAVLIVKTIPVRIRCASCGREIDPHGPEGYVPAARTAARRPSGSSMEENFLSIKLKRRSKKFLRRNFHGSRKNHPS